MLVRLICVSLVVDILRFVFVVYVVLLAEAEAGRMLRARVFAGGRESGPAGKLARELF